MPRKVTAVLLAAGASRRMGRSKQLLPVNGKAAVRFCAETILAGGVPDLVVVTAQESPVSAMVRDLAVRVVCNDVPAADMAESVRTGLRTASAGDDILICLADHPLVTAGTIAKVLSESRRFPDRIIIPRHNGRRGHPTLFPRSFINEVHGGKNLRDVINGHGTDVHHVEVDDEGVVLDMDTEEDYEKLLRRTGNVSQ